jgi:DNA-binding CsgD family transcriptional regulator
MPRKSSRKLPDLPETWHPIMEFEGKYEVSTLGRVRRAGRTLKTSGRYKPPYIVSEHLYINKNGGTEYCNVRLYMDGKSINRLAHHLMRDTFLGPRKKGDRQACCRHLNGDGTDNRLSNLVLGTVKQNAEDQRQHGTLQVGEKCWRAQLTEAQVWNILESPLSQRKIAAQMGIKRDNVKSIRQGKSWKVVYERFHQERKRKGSVERSKHSRQKLTEEKVWDILESPLSNKQIAVQESLSYSYVKALRRGRSWVHVYEVFHRDRSGGKFFCPSCDEDSKAVHVGKCPTCDGDGEIPLEVARELDWRTAA